MSNSAHTTPAGLIVVAGDVTIDWLAWPVPADPAAGSSWRRHGGTRMVARRGGALLLGDLLRATPGVRVSGPSVADLASQPPTRHLHAMIDLRPTAGGFRIARHRGFAGPGAGDPPQPALVGPIAGAAVLVLDDSDAGFRHDEDSWRNPIAAAPGWLVVRMSRPLATGAMWELARHGPPGAVSGADADPTRLVVVVDAEDLRAEGIALSRRLSWERTAEDFVHQLASNGRLATLVTCAHLLVRFGCEGLIHHRGRADVAPALFFDPAHAEGDLTDAAGGPMVGTAAAFVAGLAAHLAVAPDAAMEAGIRAGMRGARNLLRAGFIADAQGAPDYPIDRAVAADGEDPVVRVSIPRARPVAGLRWSILDEMLGDPTATARAVVTHGAAAALARAPVARYGQLAAADRAEIESYRAIDSLLREYLADPRGRPLSIGVFGPPGAGKSFGVVQIAERTAATLRRIAVLEFNLSQFAGTADLALAFHRVRDAALGGAVPLVLFDEFDSWSGAPLGWLRSFLAPMQDGTFRDGGAAYPLGAAILVFAGGTCARFAEFVAPMALPEADPARRAFVAAKGPDFASRLRGYIDIAGPNPADARDTMFQIRRALQLRSLLERMAPGVISDGRAALDDGVLNALLTVPAYRHGVRSMEALLAMSSLAGRTMFSRADLPPRAQLDLHVDGAAFLARVAGEHLDDADRDALGRRLHEVYRGHRRGMADGADPADLAADPALAEWEALDEALRASCRHQADDIPRKLRRIGCFMARPIAGRTPVTALTEEEAARLGEMEHERWNAERLQAGWRLDPRDIAGQRSPHLVPWSDLAPAWRDLDIALVRAIPAVLEATGYLVYRGM